MTDVLDARRHAATDRGDYAVHCAPYVLVRATVLGYPAEQPPATAFRAELAALARVEAALAALRPALGDALYASRAGHTEDFHREVVLPLRRALHNGREPRPALLARLADLPGRVPELAHWLTLRQEHAELLAALDGSGPPALVAERVALAALCREPALARAVALTSTDLLRAVQRAGAGAADRRARKEEPGVLRYALRASTKTSPLSWFTAVGWGPLAPGLDGPAGPLDSRGLGDLGEQLGAGPLTPVVKVNRVLVGALTQALLDDPQRRADLPHRITSTARIADGRAVYARSNLHHAGGRYLLSTEEELALPATGPLAFVTEQAEHPIALAELTDRLTAALGGPANRPAAVAFLDRLTGAGLLLPTEPVDPQAAEPLTELVRRLRGRPADAELADRLAEIDHRTETFAATPADRRPAALAELADRWHAVLDLAGRPVAADSVPLSVLSEDVVAPQPLRAAGQLTAADTGALAELTPLAELFDLGNLVRRLALDRFVARYGPGGRCPRVWEFGTELVAAWQDAGRLAALDPRQRAELPAGLAELADLRAEVLAAVAGLRGDRGAGEGAGEVGEVGDLALPVELVRGLGARLPDWAVARPLGYSYFVQRDPAAGLLCVNRVYGGWGRFSSRFLDTLPVEATDAIARQVRRGLGPKARVAQVRPVGGFNANLHPLLVPDEIGPDRRWASIGESELELWHDQAADQLRFRLRATGEPLDVLYAGFLAPVMLPQRLAPLLCDHPHGVVDFQPLLSATALLAPGGRVVRTPRLGYRHLVLQRRRWHLPAAVVGALTAELAADREVPAATAARWRALLGLPEQLFLRPAQAAPEGWTADALLTQLRQPKPQFVDLGNALQLRCLGRWLARHPGGVVLEEALPAPGGRARAGRVVELVVEAYRAGRDRSAGWSG
ncbi:lantibiotic dehydratase [Kitasatospora sp. LaBMicrA B282]|uniref:lantibiotic dehydratase n=1 Tax=Kitasatospora sp. LaBMicrA B282 TaxID=3420949 RepID=UPI003D0C96FA